MSVICIALCRDPSLGRVKTNMDGRNMGGGLWWTGKKMKEQKKSVFHKTMHSVSYVLKVSVNCVIYVCL